PESGISSSLNSSSSLFSPSALFWRLEQSEESADANPRVTPGLPIYGFARPGPRCEKLRQHVALSEQGPSSTKLSLSHLRICAESIFGDCLFQNHGATASIDLRNRFPNSDGVKRLSGFEGLN